jgi:hypothetical protein
MINLALHSRAAALWFDQKQAPGLVARVLAEGACTGKVQQQGLQVSTAVSGPLCIHGIHGTRACAVRAPLHEFGSTQSLTRRPLTPQTATTLTYCCIDSTYNT